MQTPETAYAQQLDRMCQQLADRLPCDGTRYRIAWCSPTNCRIEKTSPYHHDTWIPYRDGASFLPRAMIYWSLAHLIETLDVVNAAHRNELRAQDPDDDWQ